MKAIKQHREQIALILILLLAGFLSVLNIWNEGYGNEFYAASVRSMITSWKNFFFVSLDPGGWVTVDKPPVSLWIQAAFAKVFGFYGWSIILPQCLAAVGTVAVIYRAVKRDFGSAAGLVSALILALSPIFIVISKTNNTDSILIFFMALSASSMLTAANTGKLKHLLLSMVWLGIAYNAKTLEAFLILPALYAVYLFASTRRIKVRILHLVAATLVLAVVSLSWSVIVDLTPASERPYVDNSTTNSELELALGYNGIQRITGQSRGQSSQGNFAQFKETDSKKSDSSSSSGSSSSSDQSGTSLPNQPGNGMPSGNPPSNSDSGTSSGSSAQSNQGGNNAPTQQGDGMPSGSPPSNSGTGDGFGGGGFTGNAPGGNGGGGNGMFNGGGTAGLLRMFNTTLGGQDSWLLPLGLFAIPALLFGMRKASEPEAEARRKRRRHLLLWGVSVLTMVGYFSVSEFFHPYYISVMAPFLAALAGIGLTEMIRLYRDAKGFAGFLLPLSLAATLGVQIAMLVSYPSYAKILIPLAAVLTGIPALLLTVGKLTQKSGSGKLATACIAVAVAGLLAAPAVWTASSVFEKSFNAQIPTAGPTAGSTSSMRGMSWGQNPDDGRTNRDDGQKSQDGGSRTDTAGQTPDGFTGGIPGGMGQSSSDSKLISFLEKNNTGEKFLIAVPDASEAEPIILATGKPVMAIGGFSGNDKTLTVEKLQQMVKAGEIKYFLVGGKGGMGRNSSDEVTQWVKENGKEVSSDEWSGSSGSTSDGQRGMSGNSGTLYDLSAYKNK